MTKLILWMSATFIHVYKLCEQRREKEVPHLPIMNFLAFSPGKKKKRDPAQGLFTITYYTGVIPEWGEITSVVKGSKATRQKLP